MTSLRLSDRRTGAARLDVARIRADFPILAERIRGRPLVYLDNAATTQKPAVVIDAVRQYYESANANIHRAAHYLSARATENYEQARATVQRFLGAERPEEIVFVRGTTEAINLVAQSFGRAHLSAGDEIVITEMEHHSNIVPWQLLCEQIGARLRVAPINDDGELILDAFEALLGERTKLVAVAHVSNALGTINPVREIIEAAHRLNIPVLLDGAQGAPHLRLDVRALDCDFYTFSGHKLFAPTGIGVLYGKYDLLQRMPPYQGGGSMIRSVRFEGTTYEDPPLRFEAGTPNIAGAVGLKAAIEYLEGIGLERIAEYEQSLLDYGTEQLARIEGLRLFGTARHKASILSFVIDGIHADDIGKLADREGVAVRVGHHCAEPLMARFGIAATARASLVFYNNEDDIDRLITAVRKAIGVIRPAALDGRPAPEAEPRPEGESIEETQRRIVEEFADRPDWEDRYERIIEIGRAHPDIPEEYKQDKFIVRGCQSTVWLHARLERGRVVFAAASNAMIVNGLIALLLRVYSNRTPDEIIETEPRFIRELGLSENLSQGRANGLASMLKQIKLYAVALKTTMARRPGAEHA